MSVFVLGCLIPPTSYLPNSVSTPWVANWRETLGIAAMEVCKQTGSEITDHVLNLATHMSINTKEEGVGNNSIYLFGLQYPFPPLAVNITYCTFNLF